MIEIPEGFRRIDGLSPFNALATLADLALGYAIFARGGKSA